MSGGQKQRISLARSLYSNADIYMLDDPLSAVDSHVGKSIFDSVIGPKGLLKEKTRLFVTNSLNFLPQVDEIIMIDNGNIVENGTYNDLKDKNGIFTEFMKAYLESNESNQEFIKNITPDTETNSFNKQMSIISEKSVKLERESSILSKQNSTKKEKVGEKIIEKEKIESGNVKFSIVLEYLKVCRLWLIVIFFLMFVLSNLADMSSSFWLSDWSNDAVSKISIFANNTNTTRSEPMSKFYRLGIYSALGLTKSLIGFIANLTYVFMFIKATRILHNKLLYSVLRSDLKFFESTPNGRIVNRFTKDIAATEDLIPYSVKSLVESVLSLISTVIIISSSTPFILFALVPVIVVYVLVQRYFIPSNRQLERMQSASKSPIFAHFSETQAGVMTVRAYNLTNRFIKMMEDYIDESFKNEYAIAVSNRYWDFYVFIEFNLNVKIKFNTFKMVSIET